MAIGLGNTDNTDTASSDYPYGKVRDRTSLVGGTPANTKTLGDFHQFFARLLAKAGIVANGLPDNNYSGFQYYQAFEKLSGGLLWTDPKDIGSWNMNAGSGSLKSVAHGLPDITKIRAVEVIIINDTLDSISNLLSPRYNLISGNLVSGTIQSISSANINLAVLTGSYYESTEFNDTGINRGWFRIGYIP